MTPLIHTNLFAVLKTGMNIWAHLRCNISCCAFWLYVSPLEEIVSYVLVSVSLIRALLYESWRDISNENDLFYFTFSPQYLSNHFLPVQTGPGAHPASCKMGTWSFLGVKCGWALLLTTHPLLVLRSWKSRAVPLPTLWATSGL